MKKKEEELFTIEQKKIIKKVLEGTLPNNGKEKLVEQIMYCLEKYAIVITTFKRLRDKL